MEFKCVVTGDFFTNCYIVWGGTPGRAVLIDPADDAPAASSAPEPPAENP